MKNKTKLLALACLLFAVILSGCLGGNDPVNSNTNGSVKKEMALSENNMVLTFDFEENSANGKDWTLTESQSGILKKTTDSSASGSHTWSFQGETPGTVSLNFRYHQVSEKGESTESISYVVKVNNDKSIEIISMASSSASATR